VMAVTGTGVLCSNVCPWSVCAVFKRVSVVSVCCVQTCVRGQCVLCSNVCPWSVCTVFKRVSVVSVCCVQTCVRGQCVLCSNVCPCSVCAVFKRVSIVDVSSSCSRTALRMTPSICGQKPFTHWPSCFRGCCIGV